jgi:hypothetical protein
MINPSPNAMQSSVMNVPKHLITSTGVKSSAMRDTPLMTGGNSTTNRLSEIPHAYGQQESKTSVTNTKRNSITANFVTNDKSLRGSANKNKERPRNVDSLGVK